MRKIARHWIEPMNDSEALMVQLVDLVAADLDRDAPFGGWMVDEGERVLRGARMLLAAVRSDSVAALLDGASVIDYLGRSWLEVHAECYAAAVVMDRA
jgi:hypothetical protein